MFKLRNVVLTACLSLFIASCAMGAVGGSFDVGAKPGEVDWLTQTGSDLIAGSNTLLLTNGSAADKLPSGSKLFLRTTGKSTAKINLVPSVILSSDVTASVYFANGWLKNGYLSGSSTAPSLLDVATNTTAYHGINSGTYSFKEVVSKDKITSTDTTGIFHILKIDSQPTVDLRYSFSDSASLEWGRLQGGLAPNERTIDYRGLLEETQKIQIALMNWGPRLYTIATKADQIDKRWIGLPEIGDLGNTALSMGAMLPSGFGSSWQVNPFAGESSFTVQLTHPTDEARLYSFRWNPANTFKRGTYRNRIDGDITISGIAGIKEVTSRDFNGRPLQFVDGGFGAGTTFKALLVASDWASMTQNGVKGLSFDVLYTPKTGDTPSTTPVGLMGLELTFPVSWADLLLSGTGSDALAAIKEAVAVGTPFPDAVLANLRPQKFMSRTNGVDLVSIVTANGRQLRDFFEVRDESKDGAFAATISFKVLFADTAGASVRLGNGYFVIRDGAENGRFTDPIVISTKAGSGGGGGSGSGGSSGCNAAGAASSLLFLLISLPLLSRKQK